MAIEIYEKAVVFVDGQMLSESTSVTIDTDPKLNVIETMQKGMAGFSPGAEATTISVDSAVPRAGFEVNYIKRVQNVQVVEITVLAHGQKTTCTGCITKVSQKYGVGTAANVSFEFLGSPINETTL